MPRHDRPEDDLTTIPGIGPSLAADLRRLGVGKVKALQDRDPEQLYRRLIRVTGVRQDPCVLYAFRCAVYYASHTRHDPECLKWWNWTDQRMAERAAAGRRPRAPR